MVDPAFQTATARALTEALAQGVGRWTDEDLAIASF